MDQAPYLKTKVYNILYYIAISSKTMLMETCDDTVSNSNKNPTVIQEEKSRVLI